MKNYKINIIFYNTSTHFIVLYPNRTQRHLKNPYKAHKYRLCRDLPFIQTRKVWFDFGCFNMVIYTISY